MSIGEGFHKVPEPRANPCTNNSELGEEGEKGKKVGRRVEFWALENPTVAKEEDRTG